MGWQTLAKVIERDVNNIPLGYLQHDTDLGPLLQVLTPNSLKLNTASERAPTGLFTIPSHAKDLMSEIEKKYQFWYEIWNTDYIPLIARRQKWFSNDDDLKENDIVYFKLTTSAISSRWHIGKVEYVIPSRDMKARKVGISYKHDTEDGSRKMTIVDRPVRQVVKLCDIEDSSLLDDITAVRNAARKIIDERRIVPENEFKEADKTEVITIESSGEDDIDTVPSTDDVKVPPGDDTNETKQKIKPKKRKTEVEKLQIENWRPPTGKRSRSLSSLSPINNSNPIGKFRVSPSPTLLPASTNIGYAVYEDTEEKQFEVEGRDHEVIAGVADWERLLSNTNCDFNDDKNAYEILLI